MEEKPIHRLIRSMLLPAFVLLLAAVLSACPPNTPSGGEGEGEGEGDPNGNVSQLILDFEVDAFDLLNDERTSRGIAALTMDQTLREVARAHSEDMVDRGFFSHTNPDGLDPFDRMANAGITYSTAGENIAWNSFPDPVQTAVDGWMNSEGHRNNILNADFTLTGMGAANDGGAGYYFTQVFTRPRGKAAPGEAELEFVTWYLPPPLAMD